MIESIPIYTYLALFLLQLIFLFLLTKYYLKFNDFFYRSNIQSIHQGNPLRVGGILCIFFSFLLIITSSQNHHNEIIFSSLPILIIGILDDFNIEIKPSRRLIIMFLSIVMFFYLIDFNFPLIEFYSVSINNNIALFFIYTLMMLSIINASNMVDGINGLLCLNLIFSFLSILFLSFTSYQFYINDHILVFIISLFIFFFFNIVTGKIFLGDTGSYVFGFILGATLIIFFINSNHHFLNAWGVCLYFTSEFINTVSRRIIHGRNILTADNIHTHTLIFKILKKNNNNLLLNNNLTCMLLLPLIVSPLLITIFFHDKVIYLFFSIIIYHAIFIFLYYVLYLNFEKK